MSSPRDPRLAPVASRARISIQAVSDRLAAVGFHQDQPIPTVTEPESVPVDILRNVLASPDLVAGAASSHPEVAAEVDSVESDARLTTPPDQPGEFAALPRIETPGRLMGAGEPAGTAPGADLVGQSTTNRARDDTVPLVASAAGLPILGSTR